MGWSWRYQEGILVKDWYEPSENPYSGLNQFLWLLVGLNLVWKDHQVPWRPSLQRCNTRCTCSPHWNRRTMLNFSLHPLNGTMQGDNSVSIRPLLAGQSLGNFGSFSKKWENTHEFQTQDRPSVNVFSLRDVPCHSPTLSDKVYSEYPFNKLPSCLLGIY